MAGRSRSSASTAARRCRRSPAGRSGGASARRDSLRRPDERPAARIARSSTSTAAPPTTTSRTWPQAALAVLERNGFEVIVPPQSCCGLPLISNGLYAAARGRARGNLAVLADYARAGYRIVGTSTSCTHTLKAEYREMLDLVDDDARAVADATWDICEFLLDLHDQGRLDTRFGELRETLPYHAPCQLRSHGIGFPALDLFALVPGLEAIDMDHDCCGIAGTYGLKREKYDIAMAVGEPLFEKIRASRRGAGRLRLGDVPLADRGRDRDAPSRHPVEILAEAYAVADATGPQTVRTGLAHRAAG